MEAVGDPRAEKAAGGWAPPVWRRGDHQISLEGWGAFLARRGERSASLGGSGAHLRCLQRPLCSAGAALSGALSRAHSASNVT